MEQQYSDGMNESIAEKNMKTQYFQLRLIDRCSLGVPANNRHYSEVYCMRTDI